MSNLIIFLCACILVNGVASKGGFDWNSISKWYEEHHQASGHQSHTSGCDNVSERDHVLRLLTDWHRYHETDAFVKFYSDIALIDMETSAGSLPASRRSTHDEAYNNHDTTPDISHLEHLVRAENMNSMCRRDILRIIEKYEHISSMAPPAPTTPIPATQAAHHNTHAPHTHAPHNTHAPHTHAPATSMPITQAATTHVPTTHKPMTHAPTTHAPTMMTPQPTVAVQKEVCDQLSLVSYLAKTNIITHPLAGFCSDNTRSESEALVLQSCSAPAPVQWHQGVNVLSNCVSIPKFSPISTFLLGNYVMDGTALSGILLECLPTGFKMAAQVCGHTPQIYEILGGGTDPRQNAGSYYRITW